MQKILIYTIFGVISILAGTALADVYIEYFRAESKYNNVTLEWKSGAESGISNYYIKRSSSGRDNDFVLIAKVPAKGSHSEYKYIDEVAYKEADVSYYYRLEYDNSPTYSEVRISHNVSNVKRTWGSIKDMFR